MVEWTTQQKSSVEYLLPINGVWEYLEEDGKYRDLNLELELLDHIIFKDAIYTNDEPRSGWITKIEFDIKKDRMKIQTTLEPDDYRGLIIERGIPLNIDTITELGKDENYDTIEETGV